MQVNENIAIDWRHNVADKQTVCAITVENRQIFGVSKVGHGDMYCKKVGRKLSLTRALAKSDLNRADRTTVWTAIRNKGVKLV